MGLGQRRNHGPCWCAQGCPPYTWPYDGYFVSQADNTFVSLYPVPKLYRFFQPVSFGCEWRPVTPSPLPITAETLVRREAPDSTPELLKYTWLLSINVGPILWTWLFGYEWNTETQPYPVPGSAAESCSKRFNLLAAQQGLPGFFALIEAAYPDACVDADYPEKVQQGTPSTVP